MEASKKKFDFKDYNERMRKELVKFDHIRAKQNLINCSTIDPPKHLAKTAQK